MTKVLLGISGGNSFRDDEQMENYYRNFDIDYVHEDKYWMDWLMWSFEDVFDTVRLKMPGADNAHYTIWKIVFEKYLHKFEDRDIVLVAHSLGTTFLLKYLSENSLHVRELHLVAPFVSDTFQSPDFHESTGTFTFDYESVHKIAPQCGKLWIWYSEDDDVCTSLHAEYLHKEVENSELKHISGRGHFNQSTFFELFEKLKKDI